MIEKLDPIKHTDNLYDKNGFIANVACGGVVIRKINELIDTVNELGKDVLFLRRKVLELGYKEPDPCKSTTYITDGHTKEYYGQNGASIVTDHPLPAGYIITIREPETKGGDNEK